MDRAVSTKFVADRWQSVLPVLQDYVRIPNRSPAFDPDWERSGHMAVAVDLVASWARAQELDGATVEVVQLPGRTPLIVVEVPATHGSAPDDTVLLYGHLDKQPEMTGWRAGLGPWEPVLEGDRLYGRGAADDGYAAFAALTALRAIREGGGAHRRSILLVEASEESGSPDLPAYVDHLADRLGRVSLVVCLDSGCATYDRLWVTTSLRGLVGMTVRARILEEGIHSGASGVVPSSFRILRSLLSRIEDERTGRMLVPELSVEIPEERRRQAAVAAAVEGREACYPFVPGAHATSDDALELLLARTWQPALSVTGVDGIPALVDAGNVLRPSTAVRLSIRIPPTCPAERAADATVRTLTDEPPYGAGVDVTDLDVAPGWNAPPTAPWLAAAVEEASVRHFGNPSAAEGEGGTIPFMGMLGERFPEAQFLVVGVLGPGANAHGPNEFLHVPTAERLTACVADIVDAHARRED